MIKKSRFNIIVALSLFLWATIFVAQFINFKDANKLSVFAAKFEFVIHAITLFFIGKIYRKTSSLNKKILIWLFIGVFGLFLNDMIFYHLIYFQNNYIARLSSLSFLLDMLPFFIWAIAIIVFFYKILKVTFQPQDFYKILFVFMMLNATVIFLCFSSITYAQPTMAWQNLLQLTGYIIESVNFDLAILCLIYSKNKGLSWISAGFAVLISGDFLLTYTHLTQTDNTLGMHGELFWFLGLLFILFGLYDLKNKVKRKEIKWLIEAHSIKHIFAFWTFRVSLISILPAFILAYFFLPINKEVFLLLPSALIVYSIVLVIFSLGIGRHFETPFKQLEKNIDALMLKKDKSLVNARFSIKEFIFLQNFLNQVESAGEEKDYAKQVLLDNAKQAAHDIRSPLAAINTAVSDVTSIPEKNRIMIRNAAKRINDIANILLLQSNNNFCEFQNDELYNNDSSELIFVVLDNIVAEKRYEYYKTSVNINLNSSDCSLNCFSFIHLDSFKRVLSNLINNSIEAVNSNGYIDISLTCNTTHVEIIIEDNGCGIPSHILPKITEQGFSFNKKNGSGYGLSYSKQYIELIDGAMHIHSQEKIGTKITINLIRSSHPAWFCDSLKVIRGSIIVVLDDDPSIHDAWDERFATLVHVKLIHFFNLSELLQHKIDLSFPILYLVDYELLADVKNGLDVIEELNLNDKSILVTSCFEDVAIRNRCEDMGIKIIPKSFVPYIQIIQNPSDDQPQSLVFIDDDEMMRATWIFAAEGAGISISTYSSFDEFVDELNNYNKSTIIYIDSDLNNNIKGEFCAKYLFDQGFSEIYLATGHSRDQFEQMPWIKKIVGKEPPFQLIQENAI